MSNMLKYIGMGLLMTLFAGLAQAQSEYKVRGGDSLVIEVLEDPGLNRSVVVLPDGRFSFPFAGTLQARGRTVGDIQTDITSAIASNFATSPTVFVAVNPAVRIPTASSGLAATATMSIYLLGEVSSPGLREMAPGTTFLQALSQSGGLTDFAATKRIQLRRSSSSKVFIFNYKAISKGTQFQPDAVLQEGDVILVPERRLFE